MRTLLLLLATLLLTLSVFAADPDAFRDGEAPPVTVAIGRMAQALVLDGALGEWPADATAILLGQNTQTGRRFAWGGTRDFSGCVRLAWDAEYLYLAADVCDDRLSQATGGAEIWQGDTLELFFNTYPRQQRTDGYWQQAIVPPLKPEARLRATGPPKDFDGVEGATQMRAGGYTLECRIPWKNLAGFTPANGTALGFQVYLDDRDGTGRKTQLLWYPSAISFAQPTHTNILLLRNEGDTSLPRVLAGPPTWCVTDPKTMPVSVVVDVAGAQSATITAIAPFPDPAHVPAPVTFALEQNGERLSLGQGTLAVEGCTGLYNFAVRTADAQGRTLATNTFQAQLVGADFQRMRGLYDSLKTRVAAVGKRDDLDPQWRAGVAAWFTRVSDFVWNEARPEAINRALLAQMLTEYDDIARALTALEAGQDPYLGRTGSFVRAYRSPLTGEYRPLGLYVPTDGNAGKRPLIVLLHSIFADERMLSLLADNFKDLGAIVYQGAAYRQFDWGGVSAAETWAGLEEVKRQYAIDDDRVYLAGYHIGGRGSWQLAMARPDLWAAAAPIFSGIDTSPNYPALRLYPQYAAQAAEVRIPNTNPPAPPVPITDPLEKSLYEQASLVARAENIAHLPLRGAYGEDDPHATAERLALQARLAQLGNPVSTHYVPGAMHGSPADEFRDPAFYQWLLAQRRQAYPKMVSFSATGLRDNAAWWVRVDQMASPAGVARITGAVLDGLVTVDTDNVTAMTLCIDTRLAPAGTTLKVVVNDQTLPAITVGEKATELHLVCMDGGKWAAGTVPAGQKRHGLSGPIDDFQRDRFIFVYGTGGDEATRTALEKRGKRMADWGLGAVFSVKSDVEVTADDLRDAHLLLIGTPANNSLLAKMADRLPLRWTATGLALGGVAVDGPGAGACCIVPNPLAPDRYAVVITAIDEAGYQVWDTRAPGGDYVLGHVETFDGRPRFTPTARGWFDNAWQWTGELCMRK